MAVDTAVREHAYGAAVSDWRSDALRVLANDQTDAPQKDAQVNAQTRTLMLLHAARRWLSLTTPLHRMCTACAPHLHVRRYKGAYDEDGLYHGAGRLEALNGDVYEGNFSHGYFTGHGKYMFKRNEEDSTSPLPVTAAGAGAAAAALLLLCCTAPALTRAATMRACDVWCDVRQIRAVGHMRVSSVRATSGVRGKRRIRTAAYMRASSWRANGTAKAVSCTRPVRGTVVTGKRARNTAKE